MSSHRQQLPQLTCGVLTLDPAAPWTARIGGIRANASTMSHAELDAATELDGGDPARPGQAVLPAARPPSPPASARRVLHHGRAVMTGVHKRMLPGRGPVLAYDVGGSDDGRPLVLLHGLSANSTSWAPVIDRTAQGWRSYALDFRGHGRSDRTPGRYRLDDYIDDADRLLRMIGQPAVVVGHSLGAVVAASLAQEPHPLVAAVFLEDPPLYVVEPGVLAGTSLARGFAVLREHIARLQTERAPVETYRDLLAASPHPAGDRLGDHLHDDALWSRAGALAQTDLDAITAVLDGTTFGSYKPDRPLHRRALVVRADAAYDAAFQPDDEHRLRRTSPHVEVVAMPGAGHNIRGDRAARAGYLNALADFLAQQPATTLDNQV